MESTQVFRRLTKCGFAPQGGAGQLRNPQNASPGWNASRFVAASVDMYITIVPGDATMWSSFIALDIATFILRQLDMNPMLPSSFFLTQLKTTTAASVPWLASTVSMVSKSSRGTMRKRSGSSSSPACLASGKIFIRSST